jgi:hypothetical protein
MQKKRRKPPLGSAMELTSSMSDQLWVRPNSNLSRDPKEADARNITPASGKKLLELADIALGLPKGKAVRKSKLLTAEAHHQRLLQRKSKRRPEAN